MDTDIAALLESLIPEPFMVITVKVDQSDEDTVSATFVWGGGMTRERAIALLLDMADYYKEEGYE